MAYFRFRNQHTKFKFMKVRLSGNTGEIKSASHKFHGFKTVTAFFHQPYL